MTMDLFPAIDLRGGRCVRLVEGDFDQETVYSSDPIQVAKAFAGAGARWIHVVDLDAAKTGEPLNRPVVAAIVDAVGHELRVQTGGGVRSIEDAEDLIGRGVARVVIGTAAAQNPAIVAEAAERWPGQIAVGVDQRGGRVRVRGWTEDADVTIDALVRDSIDAGASAVIVTDISRDGRLEGPDVQGLSAVLAATGAPIIASGGVSGIGDVESLARISAGDRTLAGVIIGRAIYEGRVDLRKALAAVAAT